VETTFTPEGYDWIGHYQTVVGYDDSAQSFYVYDTYLGTGSAGEGIAEPYIQFDRDWQAFNRVFIVLYDQGSEALVQEILGQRTDIQFANEHALAVAQEEARRDPTNPFTWFNIGTALNELGQYEQAAAAYDASRQLELPFRMMWYQFGQFEAYYNVGRYDDVMGLVQTNLTNGAEYVEETFYWQGRVHEARGDTNQAIASYQQALNRNPLFGDAQAALNALT
jgi:tetratricopeptide (TPR) repeat protein